MNAAPEAVLAGPRQDHRECLDVLLVEDSADDACITADVLREGGFEPRWERVETAAGMRAALRRKTWQAILADHNLPQFSALQAFAIYREAGLDIPFLIVSGAIGEDAAIAAMKAGVHDYLNKDKLGRLAPAVRRELREAEIRRERTRAEAALQATYAELTAIHANAPVALMVVDSNLRLKRANPLAARWAGVPVHAIAGTHLCQAFGCRRTCPGSPEDGLDRACGDCPLRAAIVETFRSGTPRDNLEIPLCLLDNGQAQTHWFLVACSPLDRAPGETVLVCARDIGELKQAHFKLQQQRDAMALQAQLINLSHDAIIIADQDHIIRGWNKGAEELYGWAAPEAMGSAIDELLSGLAAPATDIEQILVTEGRWQGELEHVRRDGRRILVDSRQVLERSSDGRILAILEINRDITERRRTEDALKQTVDALESALSEKTVLLKEIHHRVKNNLSVIASLLSLKASSTRNRQARAALESSQERIHSIALLHEHLYSSSNLDLINFSEYIQGLVRELRAASSRDESHVAIGLALDPVQLGIERAVPCALILNELLTNALKHAFPGGRKGRIQVHFRQVQPGLLELVVEDDGVGPPPGWVDRTSSLGLRIVTILTRQLDGSLAAYSRHDSSQGEVPVEGARVVIRFPAQPGQPGAEVAEEDVG